jgi:hypothetical protein
MRVLVAIAVSIVFVSLGSGEVFVTVYRCDGTTPLTLKDPNIPYVYSDIMVGTRLVLVVSSDESRTRDPWWGALQSTWDNWERGKLLGRGYDPNDTETFNYWGSCLPAAGRSPLATFVEYPELDLNRVGFDLMTYPDAFPGDWFVLDYVAEEVGASEVGLFDYAVSPDTPKEVLCFTHVASRDFRANGIVDFADFASLASHWRQPADPNADLPSPYDLDADHAISPSDLGMFTEFWLERTDCAARAEPNAPAAGP